MKLKYFISMFSFPLMILLYAAFTEGDILQTIMVFLLFFFLFNGFLAFVIYKPINDFFNQKVKIKKKLRFYLKKIGFTLGGP